MNTIKFTPESELVYTHTRSTLEGTCSLLLKVDIIHF